MKPSTSLLASVVIVGTVAGMVAPALAETVDGTPPPGTPFKAVGTAVVGTPPFSPLPKPTGTPKPPTTAAINAQLEQLIKAVRDLNAKIDALTKLLGRTGPAPSGMPMPSGGPMGTFGPMPSGAMMPQGTFPPQTPTNNQSGFSPAQRACLTSHGIPDNVIGDMEAIKRGGSTANLDQNMMQEMRLWGPIAGGCLLPSGTPPPTPTPAATSSILSVIGGLIFSTLFGR